MFIFIWSCLWGEKRLTILYLSSSDQLEYEEAGSCKNEEPDDGEKDYHDQFPFRKRSVTIQKNPDLFLIEPTDQF